jgi:hypothetical protein
VAHLKIAKWAAAAGGAAGGEVVALLVAAGASAQNLPSYLPSYVQFAPPFVASDYVQSPADYARQSVLDRPHLDYDSLGLQFEGFTIFPSLTLATGYDDNIYATESGRVGDFSATVSPAFRAQSDWSVHSLTVSGNADIVRYLDRTIEDVENYNIAATGRYDVSPLVYFTGDLGYQEQHVPRGSPDPNFGLTPEAYTLGHVGIGYYHGTGRLNLTLNAAVDRYEYSNVPIAGGGVYDDELENRTEFTQIIRLGYEIIPEYEAFVRATHLLRLYDNSVDITGFNRTSDGYEAVAGTALYLGTVISGDIYAGYTQRFFEDSRLQTASAPVLGASILWNVTPDTSLRFNANRSIEETTTIGASAYVASFGQVSVEHELQRNLILTASLNGTIVDYQGISQQDIYVEASIGAKYLISRNFDASIEYTPLYRGSTAPGLGYIRNVVLLKFTAKM